MGGRKAAKKTDRQVASESPPQTRQQALNVKARLQSLSLSQAWVNPEDLKYWESNQERELNPQRERQGAQFFRASCENEGKTNFQNNSKTSGTGDKAQCQMVGLDKTI